MIESELCRNVQEDANRVVSILTTVDRLSCPEHKQNCSVIISTSYMTRVGIKLLKSKMINIIIYNV